MIEKSSIDYEKAVLIGLITQKQNTDKSNEYLDELEFLTYTAGGEVLKRFVQKMESPNSKTFLGSGKIEEVRDYIEKHEVGLVVFDDELSPAQQRNIEKILECKILDRTNLILDIFRTTSSNKLRKNSSRISTIPIFTTSFNRNVDSP